MDYRNPNDLRTLVHDANDVQIGRMLGVSSRTIRNWRHKFGIDSSSVNQGSTLYTLNQSFFRCIDTPEKAYILGFIAADGSIHKSGRSLSIAIAESDIDHLHAIRNAIGCNNEIHTKKRSSGYQGGPLAVLNLCRVEIVHDLATLGILPNKGSHLRFPSIPSHLESHLVRGLFDGDGHISNRNFSLIGTKDLIAGVQSSIHHHTGCFLKNEVANGISRLVGYRHDYVVLEWMYDGATIALQRKFEKYKTFWS
jgi:hypothetical protein